MKALVTGASGFIGQHLVKALLSQSWDVVGLTHSAQGADELKNLSCRIETGDVTDFSSLKKAVQEVDAVFHLASLVSIRASDRERLKEINVGGTQNIVSLCRELKIPRLIHASSVVAVGASESPADLLNENSPNILRKYRFPNCESKALSEEIVLKASRQGEIDAVVVNPSMVFGAGDAKKEMRRSNVMAAQGKLAFYPRGGLSVVAVEDVVSGMVAAFHRGVRSERYILSGENLTTRRLMEMHAEIAGVAPPQKAIPTPILRGIGKIAQWMPWDAPINYEGAVAATLYHWFDCSKARQKLDYQPRPAIEAIRNSVEWMSENRVI